MALIATVPALRERFFVSRDKVVQGVRHQVIGMSKEHSGVREAAPLHHFMLNAFFQGITADLIPCEDCVVITDPGQDQDDEMALIMLRNLTELRLMRCLGVVSNLQPSEARARLARGTLDVLGLTEVPVGVGTDGGSKTHRDSFSETAADYIPPVVSDDAKAMKTSGTINPDGQALLRQIYEDCPTTGTIVLICISSLKDAAQFLRENEALFVEKTKSVTIQGGCLPFNAEDQQAFLEPDTAQNNVFDREAADFFYRRCQELGVKLTVMSRESAYRCPMPRSIYDKIASTESPIGIRLRACQQQAIEDLWRRACLPTGHELRLGLPARCDKTWFCKTFCGSVGMERDETMAIWDLVKSFNMYDPMALMVSSPQLRLRFFTGKKKTINGVTHEVFGTSKEENGLNEGRVKELTEFMYHSFLKGTTLNMSAFQLPQWARRKAADGAYGGETKDGCGSEGGRSEKSGQSSRGLSGALDLGDTSANMGRSIMDRRKTSLQLSERGSAPPGSTSPRLRLQALRDSHRSAEASSGALPTSPHSPGKLKSQADQAEDSDSESESESDFHFFEFDDMLRQLLEEAKGHRSGD